MAVRVRLEIEVSGGGRVETVAVLNGGFEVELPHLLLPMACARRLIDDPTARAVLQPMEGAGGTPLEFWALTDPVTVRLVTSRGRGAAVTFLALVSAHDREALVSDVGIDALGIRIESFYPGRWRLTDEAPDEARPSEPPQYW